MFLFTLSILQLRTPVNSLLRYLNTLREGLGIIITITTYILKTRSIKPLITNQTLQTK